MGDHVLKTWSQTQAVIALSSGEAEYYGLVKGGSVGLGFAAILKELGLELKIRLKTDASAAIGIASRRGLGKIRHIEVTQLWLQDKVQNKEILLNKVDGTKNIADALTKHVSNQELTKHMELAHQVIIPGRHPIMPHCDI